MSTLYGMDVIFSSFARDIRTIWKVESTAIKKRRRGWRVVKHVTEKPACYKMGNTLVMHPDFKTALDAVSKGTP